jgi:NAD+ synthase (glutamine-hydrolysing)
MNNTTLAVCSLNQFAMDFAGNLTRIKESIITARTIHGAKIRVGPELETSGYSCEDHLIEPDTIKHSWSIIEEILKMTLEEPYNDMLIAIGAPLINKGCLYNCMVFLFNGKVWHIKPKSVIQDDGNFRESRWFVPWISKEVGDMILPPEIAAICG